jgi:hypothetical protein
MDELPRILVLSLARFEYDVMRVRLSLSLSPSLLVDN